MFTMASKIAVLSGVQFDIVDGAQDLNTKGIGQKVR